MFFLGILSIQCKIRCNRPSDTWRSTCWPPLVYFSQGRIKGEATGAIAPGPRCKGGPRHEIYMFQIKYSFEKFSWFTSDTGIQLDIIFLCCVK